MEGIQGTEAGKFQKRKRDSSVQSNFPTSMDMIKLGAIN